MVATATAPVTMGTAVAGIPVSELEGRDAAKRMQMQMGPGYMAGFAGSHSGLPHSGLSHSGLPHSGLPQSGLQAQSGLFTPCSAYSPTDGTMTSW